MGTKLANVIDFKLIRIIRLVLTKPDELFHIQKISSETKVPLGSTFRLIQKLTDIKLLDIIIVGKTKLYKLNKKNSKEFEILR